MSDGERPDEGDALLAELDRLARARRQLWELYDQVATSSRRVTIFMWCAILLTVPWAIFCGVSEMHHRKRAGHIRDHYQGAATAVASRLQLVAEGALMGDDEQVFRHLGEATRIINQAILEVPHAANGE